MKYEYKVVPVPRNLATKQGKDLANTIAEYVENTINNMANDNWEFYRADEYTACEVLGCLAALTGQTGKSENYNLLVFRREK